MTDRIDKYLDGDLDRIALTREERAQAEAIERAIAETRTFIDAMPAPDLTSAVMSRVQQGRARRSNMVSRFAAYLWAPREVSLQFRPAYGLLSAAAIASLTLAVPRVRPVPAGAPIVASHEAAQKLFVQFRLQAADASTVWLAGSFTDWQPQHELHQSAPGIWTVTLPLPAGVHDYAFVVDGMRWVPDPYAQTVDDGFGGFNSRLALLQPEGPRS